MVAWEEEEPGTHITQFPRKAFVHHSLLLLIKKSCVSIEGFLILKFNGGKLEQTCTYSFTNNRWGQWSQVH